METMSSLPLQLSGWRVGSNLEIITSNCMENNRILCLLPACPATLHVRPMDSGGGWTMAGHIVFMLN